MTALPAPPAIRATARSLDYGWRWVWSAPPFTGPLSSEEATAWLQVACTDRSPSAEGARKMAAFEAGSDLVFKDACLLAICSMLAPRLPMAALVAVAGAEGRRLDDHALIWHQACGTGHFD